LAALKYAKQKGQPPPFLAIADLKTGDVTGVVALPSSVDGIKAAAAKAK